MQHINTCMAKEKKQSDLERSKKIVYGMLDESLPVLKKARELATDSQDANMIGAYTGLLNKMGVLAVQVLDMNKKDQQTKQISGARNKSDKDAQETKTSEEVLKEIEDNEDVIELKNKIKK